MALYYCKRCGRIVENSWDKNDFECDCCKSITYPVPKEFLDKDLDCFFANDDIEKQFIDEYIKSSPELDQYLFDHREELLEKQSADFNAKMEHGKSILEEKSRVPKCPTCFSTNVQKIGTGERAVSVAMLGIFSKKINKTYKCKNCGYTW